MAQIIRKYDLGGGLTFAESNPYVTIYGTDYNKDQFKQKVLGSDWEDYIKRLGYSTEEVVALRNDMDDQLNKILAGDITFSDKNTLEDKSGTWSNTGVIKEGKNLTEEDKRNNRSIAITNYLVDRFQNKRVSAADKPSSSYLFDLGKQIQDNYFGGQKFDLNIWNDYDQIDSATKLRSVSERAKLIGGLIENEARKLAADSLYRHQYSWEGKDYKNYINTLYTAAGKLKDGKVDKGDLQALAKVGVVGLDKYLSTNPNKAKELTEESKKKQDEQKAKKGFRSVQAWSTETPIFDWDGSEYVLGSQELTDLINQNEEARKLYDEAYSKNMNHKFRADEPGLENYYNQGYRYVTNLSSFFPGAEDLQNFWAVRKDAMSPEGMVFLRNGEQGILNQQEDGNYIFTVGDKVYNMGRGVQSAIPADFEHKAPSYRAEASTPINWDNYGGFSLPGIDSYISQETRTDSADLAKHFEEFVKRIRSGEPLPNVTYRSSNGNKTEKAVRFVQQKNGTWALIVQGPNGSIAYELNHGVNPNTKSDLSYKDVKKVSRYKKTEKNKEGGILKAQAGAIVSYNQPKIPQAVKSPESYTAYEVPEANASKISASFSSEENRNQQNTYQQELTGTDFFRLGNAVVDLASVGAAFVPGLNIASAATGAAASVGEFGADMTDLLAGREGAQGFWSSLGELGLNLGMDAVSLLPIVGKAPKVTSKLVQVAKYAPHIAGAIQTYNLISDDDLRKSVFNTLGKVQQLDITKLNTQDYRNLAYLGRTILGLKGAYQQTRQYMKSKPQKTGTSEIEGEIKVGGETITFKTTISDENLKGLKGLKEKLNGKSAKEVLAEAAKKDPKIRETLTAKLKDKLKEGETIEDAIDNALKNITTSGKVKVTPIKTEGEAVEAASPKKIAEGWFGYKGKDAWFSDYALAKTNPTVGKLYGITEDQQKTYKEVPAFREALRNSEAYTTKAKDVDELLAMSDDDLAKLMLQEKNRQTLARAEKRRNQFKSELDEKWKAQQRTALRKDTESLQPKVAQERADLQNAQRTPEQLKTAKREEFKERKRQKYRAAQEADRVRVATADYERSLKPSLREQLETKIQERRRQEQLNREHAQKERELNKLFQIASIESQSQRANDRAFLELLRSYRTKKKQPTGAAQKAKEQMYERIFESVPKEPAKLGKAMRTKIAKKAKDHTKKKASKKQFGGKFDQAFKMFEAFKQGGSVVRKFNPGGPIDWWLNLNVGSEGVNKDTEFTMKGQDNSVTVNNNNSLVSTNTYTDKKAGRNYTYQDAYNEASNYANSDKVVTDIKSMYNVWKQSKPNGTFDDFVAGYNANVNKARNLRKSLVGKNYGYNNKDVSEFNRIMKMLYPSYGTKYDPTQFGTFGGATFRRFGVSYNPQDAAADYRYFNLSNSDATGQGFFVDNNGFIVRKAKPTPTETKVDPMAGVKPAENTEVKPEEITVKVDPTKVGTQHTANDWKRDPNSGKWQLGKLNKPDLLSGLIALNGIWANNKATNELLKFQPVTHQAPWLQSAVHRDYLSEQKGEGITGQAMSQLDRTYTADPSKHIGGWLSVATKLGDIQHPYIKASRDTFYQTNATSQAINNQNETARVTTENNNTSANVSASNYKNKLRADRITNIISQNVNPFLADIRNRALQELKLKQAKASKYAELDAQDSMSKFRLDMLAKAKTVLGEDTVKGKTDSEIMTLYLSDPTRKRNFDVALRKVKEQIIESSMNTMDSDSKGLFHRTPVTYTSTITGETITEDEYKQRYMANGGSIKDKIKLQRVKDFNKARIKDSEMNTKSILETMKMSRNTKVSSEVRDLIKRAIQ